MKKKRNSQKLFETYNRSKRRWRYNQEAVAFCEKLPIIKCGNESVGRKRIPREWKRENGRVIAPR